MSKNFDYYHIRARSMLNIIKTDNLNDVDDINILETDDDNNINGIKIFKKDEIIDDMKIAKTILKSYDNIYDLDDDIIENLVYKMFGQTWSEFCEVIDGLDKCPIWH